MAILEKINRCLSEGIIALLGGILVIMLFSIVGEVVLREAFQANLDWVIEANRIIFVWISYLGAAYGFAKCSHIRVEFFANMFSARGQLILGAIMDILCCVFFLVMAKYGFDMVIMGRTNVFSTIKISYMWLYLPIFIFGVFSLLFTIENVIKKVQAIRRGSKC